MNKTEQAYGKTLELRKQAGEIADYVFEGIKLKLGSNWKTTYLPDFLVIMPCGAIEVHEVKGYWEDDARVKIKVAAELFPFKFVAVTKRSKGSGGGWAYEEF